MNIFEWALIILGSMTVIAIILYASTFKKTIIKSTVSSDGGKMDQYYYLPHAHLTLKATATIVVEKSATSNIIISHKLVELSFEPTVHLGPDPESRVSVTYKGNWFTNDEFQIATSTDGLLEDVKVVSEDRLSNIIAQVTQAPAAILSDMKTISFMREEVSVVPSIVEVIQETRVFTITSEDLAGGKIEKDWLIPIKGVHDGTETTADASFILNNSKTFESVSHENASYGGLLTHPIVEQTWTLDKAGLDGVSFICLVPDTSVLIKVPVKRSHFIKRQHLPKFRSGLLVENAITKPSEFEGMISIPINILKAIVSIPAQLFQFKISRLKQDTEFEKTTAELVKVRNEFAARQHPADIGMLSNEIEKLKKITNRLGSTPEEPQQQTRLPRLGKLPVSRTNFMETKGRLTPILKEEAISADEATINLPSIEEPHSWAEKNSVWDVYDNFDYKTCVPASGAYLLTSWTSNSMPPTVILRPEVVMDTLKAVAPGGDIEKGCNVGDFLTYWRDNGMGGMKITDSLEISIQKPELLKQAIYWFGGCIVGLRLPSSMKTKDLWVYHASLELESKEGHAVCAIGYSGNMFMVISFGKEIRMDAEFYQHLNDETHLVLSSEHWTTSNRNKAPTKPQVSFEQLIEITEQLTTL